MNFSHVFSSDSTILQATFALLCVLSVASWYIIFWKAFKLKKERDNLKAFKEQYVLTPDWPSYVKLEKANGAVALLVKESQKLKPILAAYSKEDRKDIISMHLSQSLDVIRSWMDKGLTFLASVGSAAPFIGLFGTVWGIYGALTKISMQGTAGLNVVAGPMGEALVATAIGLFAAIPAVLAYNAFVRLNRLHVQDLRHIAEQMTLYLSISPSKEKDSVKVIRDNR